MGITPKQFEQLQQRAQGRRVPAPALELTPMSGPAAGMHQLILGVDPSLRGTGYGVIRLGRPHPVAVAHGTIKCPAGWPRSRCLVQIATTLREVIRSTQPTACAVEGLFYAQNLQTAIIMGEARGAALVVVGEAGLEVFEIAPRKVKLAVVGYGAAQKLAVARMVQRMLALPEPPAPDAADALALALAHAQETGRHRLVAPKRL